MIQYPLVEGYLKLSGITVAEICKDLGITRRTWSNKVSGKSDFTLAEASYIANATGKSVDEIFLQSRAS